MAYMQIQRGGIQAPKNPYTNVGGVTNPWGAPFAQTYAKAAAPNPYAEQWKQAVARAAGLGQRDYTGDMRRMALEDVAVQQKRQESQMRGMGMGELALATDVQQEWNKQRNDATVRAGMAGQQLQQSALESWRSLLGAAQGAELDQIASMLAAAAGGGGNYNQFAQMVIPLLMEKARMGNNGTGGPQQTAILGSVGGR